jgi:hypothetical protein
MKDRENGLLTIYNVLGQKVLSQKYESGFLNLTWDATNQAYGSGRLLNYLTRLCQHHFSETFNDPKLIYNLEIVYHK